MAAEAPWQQGSKRPQLGLDSLNSHLVATGASDTRGRPSHGRTFLVLVQTVTGGGERQSLGEANKVSLLAELVLENNACRP